MPNVKPLAAFTVDNLKRLQSMTRPENLAKLNRREAWYRLEFTTANLKALDAGSMVVDDAIRIGKDGVRASLNRARVLLLDRWKAAKAQEEATPKAETEPAVPSLVATLAALSDEDRAKLYREVRKAKAPAKGEPATAEAGA